MIIMSKIFDGIIGFIVGDAMGVPTEFCMRKNLMESPVLDMIGYGSHKVPAGSWSDDTSMTLALIDSINNKNNIDYNDICDNFVKWVEEAKYTPTDEVFDIGRTCLQAIRAYSKSKDPLNSGLTSVNSNGNGSLMRILPLAYYIYYKKITDEKEIIELVNNISALTHAHEISKMGCYIYVKYILYLLEGKDTKKAYALIKKLDYSHYQESTINAYNRILKEDISKYKLDEIESTGYVVSTLEAVLWMLFNTTSYQQAIIGSINLGNDTDTIAAICGSIAGIVYGYYQIPTKWIDKLQKKNYLIDLINKFEYLLCDSKKDAILGTMVGDIAGSRFELNNCKDINFDFMPLKKCRATDDSVMTLAIAKTLTNEYKDLSEAVIENMVEVGRKYQQCGFGIKFFNWIKGDNHEPYNSYGNGAAMRISPVGIVAKNEEDVKKMSYEITAVSHNHPDGIKGAEAVAMMIYLIRQGKSKEELKEYFINNYYPIDFTIEELRENYRFKISCEKTVPQAFLVFYESINFEDAIRQTMMIGGDSDTLGAICGAMASEYYGIPKYINERIYHFLDEYQIKIYENFIKKHK